MKWCNDGGSASLLAFHQASHTRARARTQLSALDGTHQHTAQSAPTISSRGWAAGRTRAEGIGWTWRGGGSGETEHERTSVYTCVCVCMHVRVCVCLTEGGGDGEEERELIQRSTEGEERCDGKPEGETAWSEVKEESERRSHSDSWPLTLSQRQPHCIARAATCGSKRLPQPDMRGTIQETASKALPRRSNLYTQL